MVINGEPELLFGMWQPQTVANAELGIDNLGVNLIIGTDPPVGQPDQGIAAAVNGQAWVLERPGVSGEPNQIGEYLEDEPDGYGDPPSDFSDLAASGGITYQNYSEHVADGVTPSPSVSQNDYTSYFANLNANGAGVASLDMYPVNSYSCSQRPITVSSIYDYVVTLRGRVPADMPVGAYIETGREKADSCPIPPTPAQIVSEMREAVAAGATMINPWAYGLPSGVEVPYVVSPEDAAAFKSEVGELEQYSSILLAPQNRSWISPQGEVIKFGERIIGSGANQTDAIVAVNGTAGALSWKGNWPDLTNQQITSVNDGSKLQATDGQVSLTIPGNSWQIYEYPASPEPPLVSPARRLAAPERAAPRHDHARSMRLYRRLGLAALMLLRGL